MKMKIIIITLVLLLPQLVIAAPNAAINTNFSSIENGGSVTVTVTLTDTAAWNIKIVGSGAAVCSNKYADVTSDGKSTTKTFTLSCTATKEGTINFQVTGDITSGNGETKDISLSKNVTVTKPKSSVNTLSDLKVNGNTVSGFSSSTTSYTIKNTNDTSISITATATDSKATISGVGNKSLKVGTNRFNIVVTAENGSKKTYTIVVNKNDTRSNNNYLKSLSISEGAIDFEKNNLNYTVKVKHDVNEININAIAEDSKAVVSGAGVKSLLDYSNEFKITVKAENEDIKTYVLKIIREDANGNYGKLSDDCSVKDITISGYDFKFDQNIKKYNLIIEDIDKLDINVIVNDENATVAIENNTNLKVGLNNVVVKVTSESGILNEYLFNVYKIDEKNKEQTCECNLTKKNIKWMIISLIEFSILLVILLVLIVQIKNK